MFFFYIGLAEKRPGNHFNEKFLKSCTISMIIGLALYVITPGWYVLRRIQIAEMTSWSGTSYDADSLLSSMRFSSYFSDSYEVSTFGMIALSIALFVFFIKSFKGKRWLGISFIIINYAAAVISQQRVAMAMATFAVIFYIFYGLNRGHGKQSRTMLIAIISLTVMFASLVVFYMGDRAEQLQFLLFDRLENMDVSSALEERNYQIKLLDSWTMPITGHGTGAGGSKAGLFGLPHVNDNNYLQLLYENGIIGALLFTLVIGRTLIRSVKHMRCYLTELIIIMFFLAAMVGSNILNFGYMLVIPFWYAIGRVWNKNHYKNALLNKDYI
jgi:O-antigen ligase